MFEHSLLASQRRSRLRILIVPVAVAAHALAVGAVAVGQYWTVGPVAVPAMQVSFVAGVAPPARALAPPPAGERRRADARLPVEAPTQPVQPVAIPETLSVAIAPLDARGVTGGIPGGDPDGKVGGALDGVPAGVPSGVPNGVPVDGEAVAGIRRVGGDVEPPVALYRVQPGYTEPARRVRLEGVVVVEAILDVEGRVTDVRVLKPLGMGLSEAAVDAVAQWRFRPATVNGRPVSVYFTLTVKFELQ
jgi:protein TonB